MIKLYKLVCLVLFSLSSTIAQEAGPDRWQEEALIIPEDYNPQKKAPLILVKQRMIDDVQLKGTPYFAAYEASSTIVMEAANKFNFDPYRIYYTAFSRSGHGVLEAAWKSPHTYAAIAPVCNDLRVKSRYSKEAQKILYVKYLQQTPTLLIHGDRDSFVKTGKKLYDMMVKENCPVKWDTYPGGHTPYPVYFKNMKPILDHFDENVLNPWPKEVIHVVCGRNSTRAFWVDSKMGSLKPFGKKIPFPSWKIKIKEPNKIEVLHADDAVKALIFHLNENLVDMKKDVQVLWKDKAIYKGPAKPVLEIKLNDGVSMRNKTPIPLWERLKTFYETPQKSGSFDWVYLMMNTDFKDNRYGNTVPRKIFLDLGFRVKGDAPKAVIDPLSKKFVSWDLMKKEASQSTDASKLKRKLPVTVQTFSQKFSLKGVVDSPDATSELSAADDGKSGDVIVIKVRLENKGDKDIDVTSKINRTVFKRFHNKVFPKSGDGKNFFYGIWEMAGTKQIQWQWLKHKNEAYHILGYVFLNPGDLPEASQLFLEGCGHNDGFYGAQRDLVLKANETIEFPMMIISAHSPDPKAKKPAYPDLGKVINTLRPSIMKAYNELGK